MCLIFELYRSPVFKKKSISKNTIKIHRFACNIYYKAFVLNFLSDVCIAGDDVYMHGEDFITDDCTARCRCISGPTGQGFQCQNLCPLSNQCPPGETVHRTTKYAVPNSKCSCTEQQCIKKEDGKY